MTYLRRGASTWMMGSQMGSQMWFALVAVLGRFRLAGRLAGLALVSSNGT